MSKNHTIDLVKFFAIVSVVCIHAGPFYTVNLFGLNGSYISNIIIAIARVGVPIFFAISGYLFTLKVNKNPEAEEYFLKYIKKTLKLFLTWYLFYLLYDIILIAVGSKSNIWNYIEEVKNYLGNLPIIEVILYGQTGNSSYQLWYLIALIWAIVILFVGLKYGIFKYLFILSFILNIIGLFGQGYSGIYELTFNTREALFFGMFYVNLGALSALNSNRIAALTRKLTLNKTLILITLFCLLQALERFATIVLWNPNSSDYFISTIPATLLIMVLIVKFPNLSKYKWLNKIGNKSVGIYVTHVLFVELVNNFISSAVQSNMVFNLIIVPVILILSYHLYLLLVTINNKINFTVKTRLVDQYVR